MHKDMTFHQLSQRLKEEFPRISKNRIAKIAYHIPIAGTLPLSGNRTIYTYAGDKVEEAVDRERRRRESLQLY